MPSADRTLPAPARADAPLPAADVLAAIAADATADAARPFVELIAGYFAAASAGEGAVSSALAPAALAARFAEPLPHGGRPLADVVARLAHDVVADANRLCHPMYLGHQVSAPLPAAVWAEALVAALNQSVAVSEMSPTATAVEGQVVRWMADLAGFGPRAGGTFTSGGTEATFAALLAARSRAVPNVWADGLGADPPVVVCGEHAHYAVGRAAGEMGLGQRNVLSVASRDHRMDPDALGRTLADLDASGRRVMAVVATAGSTATGAFDDLDAVADLCEARGLWLHVDGAHGASALLSASTGTGCAAWRGRHSLAWDPHKMLLLPLSAGVVLVREERWLEAAFAQAAPYLFHGAARRRPRTTRRTPRSSTARRACGTRACAASSARAAPTRSRRGWPFQRYGADGLGRALRPAVRARRAAARAARGAPGVRGGARAREQHPVLPAHRGRRRRGRARRAQRAHPGALQRLGRRVDHDHGARRPPRAAGDGDEPANHRRAPGGPGRRTRRGRRGRDGRRDRGRAGG
jgi:L-2,4-diaminobutyrate decarboxylase